MKIAEVFQQKKPVIRMYVMESKPKYALMEAIKKDEHGFFILDQDVFEYTVTPIPNANKKGKYDLQFNGNERTDTKHVNPTMLVHSFDVLEPGSKRYEQVQNVVERMIAENCGIAVPPEKSIILA